MLSYSHADVWFLNLLYDCQSKNLTAEINHLTIISRVCVPIIKLICSKCLMEITNIIPKSGTFVHLKEVWNLTNLHWIFYSKVMTIILVLVTLFMNAISKGHLTMLWCETKLCMNSIHKIHLLLSLSAFTLVFIPIKIYPRIAE
jgi:hypothetical protein